MLYVVTYFKISTIVHTFLGDNMHYKVLYIGALQSQTSFLCQKIMVF